MKYLLSFRWWYRRKVVYNHTAYKNVCGLSSEVINSGGDIAFDSQMCFEALWAPLAKYYYYHYLWEKADILTANIFKTPNLRRTVWCLNTYFGFLEVYCTLNTLIVVQMYLLWDLLPVKLTTSYDVSLLQGFDGIQLARLLILCEQHLGAGSKWKAFYAN